MTDRDLTFIGWDPSSYVLCGDRGCLKPTRYPTRWRRDGRLAASLAGMDGGLRVVPDDFVVYFATAATAAGALIGLLFVAASLRPETVLGRDAPPAARAIAGSAFTALVNSFFVSLIACIPGTRLGYPAAVMALISLWGTLRMQREMPHHDDRLLQLLLALVTYLGQFGVGLASIISPRTQGYVEALAYLLIASFSVALRRAWSLLQGKHLPVP